MKDITIKGVPEECEEEVKQVALVAVRRFYEKTELQIDEIKVTAFNSKMHDFAEANNMLKEEQPKDI